MARTTMGSSLRIGIAGVGLMGRLLAYDALQQGWHVTLFDKDTATATGTQNCGTVGGGFLSPYSACALESAPPFMVQLGLDALPRWQVLAQNLGFYFQQEGTVLLAHGPDTAELDRVHTAMAQNLSTLGKPEDVLKWLDADALQPLEASLADTFARSMFVANEGQIENQHMMPKLAEAIQQHPNAHWHTAANVMQCRPNTIVLEDGTSQSFDWVLDTRGTGARPDVARVRGIRGEIIRVRAPEVHISRPVCLIHPRTTIYIGPRPNHRFVIGASYIESESMQPVTVQSTLELLSAAFSVHRGFAEATIDSMLVQCRPALPDNCPAISHVDGLLRINGLHRNGFMVGPTLAHNCHVYNTRAPHTGPVYFTGATRPHH
ncbi:MAG: FAD-dependent oxidoreductase [Vampirovibrionales bacterium]